MAKIVEVHHPNVKQTLIEEAIARFYYVRSIDGLRKAPSTSELIDWIGALIRGGISEDELTNRLPYSGTLIKKEQDEELLRRITKKFSR